MYHVTDYNTGEYDAKIDQHPEGMEVYTTDDDWKSHDHVHVDNNGNETLCHGMEERDWETRSKS